MIRRPWRVGLLVLVLAALSWLVLARPGSWVSPRDHVERKLTLLQSGKREAALDCGDLSALRTFLVLGQSNAANHGEPRGESGHGLVWWEGRCFALVDPVPGGTGSGGSVWPSFADEWFARTGERSLFVVLGVDGTSAGEWAGNPHLVSRQNALLDYMARHGLRPDAVLWQQGEADAQRGVSATAYSERLGVVLARLRASGVSSPVFLARSTRCRSEAFEPVRLAVAGLIDVHADVFSGADTDHVGLEARHDGCHFGPEGLKQAARAWVDVLLQSRALRPLPQP